MFDIKHLDDLVSLKTAVAYVEIAIKLLTLDDPDKYEIEIAYMRSLKDGEPVAWIDLIDTTDYELKRQSTRITLKDDISECASECEDLIRILNELNFK